MNARSQTNLSYLDKHMHACVCESVQRSACLFLPTSQSTLILPLRVCVCEHSDVMQSLCIFLQMSILHVMNVRRRKTTKKYAQKMHNMPFNQLEMCAWLAWIRFTMENIFRSGIFLNKIILPEILPDWGIVAKSERMVLILNPTKKFDRQMVRNVLHDSDHFFRSKATNAYTHLARHPLQYFKINSL